MILGRLGVMKRASVGEKAIEEVLEYEIQEEEVYEARGNWHNIKETRSDLLEQLWRISQDHH